MFSALDKNTALFSIAANFPVFRTILKDKFFRMSRHAGTTISYFHVELTYETIVSIFFHSGRFFCRPLSDERLQGAYRCVSGSEICHAACDEFRAFRPKLHSDRTD